MIIISDMMSPQKKVMPLPHTKSADRSVFFLHGTLHQKQHDCILLTASTTLAENKKSQQKTYKVCQAIPTHALLHNCVTSLGAGLPPRHTTITQSHLRWESLTCMCAHTPRIISRKKTQRQKCGRRRKRKKGILPCRHFYIISPLLLISLPYENIGLLGAQKHGTCHAMVCSWFTVNCRLPWMCIARLLGCKGCFIKKCSFSCKLKYIRLILSSVSLWAFLFLLFFGDLKYLELERNKL